MTAKIAYCGLDCSDCEAYRATQANDEAWKAGIAGQWAQQFNAPGLTAAYVTCDGCMAFDGRLGGHCLECEYRQCGMERGFQTCSECSDYPCEKLQSFFTYAPEARENLDNLRQAH